MNRRAFFGLIAAGLAAADDPERLLWVPGRKKISIPAPPPPIDPIYVYRDGMAIGVRVVEIRDRDTGRLVQVRMVNPRTLRAFVVW